MLFLSSTWGQVLAGLACVLYAGSLPLVWTLRAYFSVLEGLFETYVLRWDRLCATRTCIAWFDDLDFNMHMSNSSYFKMFDFARFHYGAKNLGYRVIQKGSSVASSHVRFMKPIRPFQVFKIHTRTLYLDRKWYILEQRMVSSRGLHCLAYFKIVFKERSGKTIPVYELSPDFTKEMESLGDKRVMENFMNLDDFQAVENPLSMEHMTPRAKED